MPRKRAKDVPGTERYRDERRKGGGPRMHARQWHDHDEPHDLERVSQNEGKDAVIEAESGGDRAGMGRRRMQTAGSQGRERRKRTVPPSKGLPKSAARKRGYAAPKRGKPASKRVSTGTKAKSGTRAKAGAKGPRRV
jgi:hypothetical protein